MRVLFTTQPALGHFHPLVPLAQALTAAGHQVAVACAASFCPTVEASGLTAIPAGLDWLEEEILAAFPEITALPLGADRSAWVFHHIFAGQTAERMAADLLALADAWQPDIFVRETLEFGGCLAADVLDLPHAVVQTIAFKSEFDVWVRPALDAVRSQLGLSPDPDLTMLRRYLHLSFVPLAFQNPQAPLPPTHHNLRPAIFDQSGQEETPGWLATPSERPIVYVTLGTVVNRFIPGLFEAIIAGLRDEVGTLIVTVGRNVDPADFGSQPDHVRIERYIPQSLLLPQCDLVVTHGGSGTVMAALAHGLPLVVIPIAADQPFNAERVAALGLGRVVEREERTPEGIRTVARAVLNDSSYGERVRQLRDQVATLPGSEHGVALLEQLVADRTPQLAAM
ncbi:glycosyltransferase [soil metagenome]